MIKANITEKTLAIKKVNLAKMVSNPEIIAFLKAHQLDAAFLETNYLVFLDFLKSYELCKNCRGLNECTQRSLGHCMALSFIEPEGFVINELVNCAFAEKKLANEAHLKYFVYNDIAKANQCVFFEDAIKGASDKNLCMALAYLLTFKTKKGLYIYGDLGVGKTYLCASLMNSLAKKGIQVAFVKVGKLIEKARTLTIADKEAYDILLNDLMTVPYLTLDDIGTEGITAFSRDDVLFNILDYRMEHDLTTLFTSNADMDKLYSIYQFDKYAKEDQIKASRLLERIKKLTTGYCLKGENLRYK